MLRDACTIHKVQGFTITNTIIVLDLLMQKSFNCGQIYVALSRAKSLAGFTIIGDFRREFIKAHSEVIKEYEGLRNDSV